jgi:hypothetical protein
VILSPRAAARTAQQAINTRQQAAGYRVRMQIRTKMATPSEPMVLLCCCC